MVYIKQFPKHIRGIHIATLNHAINLHPVTSTAISSLLPTQDDVQTGLPISTIIILSTVIPSTLVLLMIVCTVVVIILIVRQRIARKQVDAAHEHIGKRSQFSSSHLLVCSCKSLPLPPAAR